jgi:hypothetical protein
MKKLFFLSFLFLMVVQFSNAQCPVAPRYLNASNATDSGFVFVFNEQQPSCDSVFGVEIGVKEAGGKWTYYEADSLTQEGESDWPFGLILSPNTFTVGTSYAWKLRTYTYKGGISLSAWVTGKAFTPADPTATGNCAPPAALCLFTPGSTTVTCIWEEAAGPWNQPTKYQFETKAGTAAWVSSGVKAIAGGINKTGLTASTNYDWRVRFKCGTQNSVWETGPAFSTTAGLAGSEMGVSGTVKHMHYLGAKNIKHEADESSDEAETLKAPVTVSASSLEIYPNPANSQLHMQFGGADLKANVTYTVSLKDMSGHNAYTSSNVTSYNLKSLVIDVTRMSPGIYFLQINGSDNSVITKKVVVARQ